MYAFHLDVPAGAIRLEVARVFDFSVSGHNAGLLVGGVVHAGTRSVLSWNQVLLYPKSVAPDDLVCVREPPAPRGLEIRDRPHGRARGTRTGSRSRPCRSRRSSTRRSSRARTSRDGHAPTAGPIPSIASAHLAADGDAALFCRHAARRGSGWSSRRARCSARATTARYRLPAARSPTTSRTSASSTTSRATTGSASRRSLDEDPCRKLGRAPAARVRPLVERQVPPAGGPGDAATSSSR